MRKPSSTRLEGRLSNRLDKLEVQVTELVVSVSGLKGTMETHIAILRTEIKVFRWVLGTIAVPIVIALFRWLATLT